MNIVMCTSGKKLQNNLSLIHLRPKSLLDEIFHICPSLLAFLFLIFHFWFWCYHSMLIIYYLLCLFQDTIQSAAGYSQAGSGPLLTPHHMYLPKHQGMSYSNSLLNIKVHYRKLDLFLDGFYYICVIKVESLKIIYQFSRLFPQYLKISMPFIIQLLEIQFLLQVMIVEELPSRQIQSDGQLGYVSLDIFYVHV